MSNFEAGSEVANSQFAKRSYYAGEHDKLTINIKQ